MIQTERYVPVYKLSGKQQVSTPNSMTQTSACLTGLNSNKMALDYDNKGKTKAQFLTKKASIDISSRSGSERSKSSGKKNLRSPNKPGNIYNKLGQKFGYRSSPHRKVTPSKNYLVKNSSNVRNSDYREKETDTEDYGAGRINYTAKNK